MPSWKELKVRQFSIEERIGTPQRGEGGLDSPYHHPFYRGTLELQEKGRRPQPVRVTAMEVRTAYSAKKGKKLLEKGAEAGVKFPEVIFHKQGNRWFQIWPQFESELSQKKRQVRELTWEQLKEHVDQMTRIANAGYLPQDSIFVYFEDPRQGFHPLNFEMVYEETRQKRVERLVRNIRLHFNDWSIHNPRTGPIGEQQTVKALLDLAEQTANEKLKASIRKQRKSASY